MCFKPTWSDKWENIFGDVQLNVCELILLTNPGMC